MAHQEEGWPLGLIMRPINNGRNGGIIRRGSHNSHSLSFSSLLSPSSHLSSSDLDSLSTGSFFNDRSITLGNLIGISNILELSRRSTRIEASRSQKRNLKCYKPWIFSLCSKINNDAISHNHNNGSGIPQSLGYFLQAERRALGAITQ